MKGRLAAGVALALLAGPALAETTFAVTARELSDQKAVFATVESANVVPARARIGGTIAELRVGHGDKVAPGTPLAVVGDQKLALQVGALEAQISALQAQLSQARTDLQRAEELSRQGAIPRARLDEARTAVNVASNQLKARTAERSVVSQQLSEGAVMAPVAGRVLKVPVTVGTVVMPGEAVAQIAEESYVLRLRVPERHARFMKAGDPVRVDGGAAGTIVLVYPQIEDGRVVADAHVDGIGDYFVGERVRVWVSGAPRRAYVVPRSLVTTRAGVDYVRLQQGAASTEVPVQRGLPQPLPDLPDGIELLSGVAAGDVLVSP